MQLTLVSTALLCSSALAAPLQREENLDIGSIVGSIVGDVLGGSGGSILKRDLIDGMVARRDRKAYSILDDDDDDDDDDLENRDIKILSPKRDLIDIAATRRSRKGYAIDDDDDLENRDIKILSPNRDLIDIAASMSFT
ncbi:hypothetical protein AZE42_13078 [Rhizopogon vesiculosus]|uniref:Glycine zipper 2TM domain-containing protein n=1 Tax=Rhizopogon vesiculosus TaxID=180088 RepID=A0A1J8RFT1_9AGAM|nr:hypothetical protein AZE42_13078 [Rhizopogon vesiculosus]